MNLSKSSIKEKIQKLHEKILFITSHILLLERNLEVNMNDNQLSIFDIAKSKQHQARIQGKWCYKISTNDFVETIKLCPSQQKTKPDNLPSLLFFGEEQSGTDTENILSFYIDKIYIKGIPYNFLLMNLDDNLILFDRGKTFESNPTSQNINFHVYQRMNSTSYKKSELNEIIEKVKYCKIYQTPLL